MNKYLVRQTNQKINQILKYFGFKDQLVKLAEECCELAVDSIKISRLPFQEKELTAFIGEIADVEIMISQAKLMIGEEWTQRIELIKDFKIERTSEYIASGEYKLLKEQDIRDIMGNITSKKGEE